MPKFKSGFGINSDAAKSADAGDIQVGYQGPIPPKGPYHGVLKRLQIVKTGPNSQNPGTPMLKMLVEIKEPNDSKKKQYNGYGLWNNQMITEQSAPYVNQFLTSLAGGNEAKAKAIIGWFWDEQIQTDQPEPPCHVLAIGKLKVLSPDCNIPVIVNTKLAPARGEYDERLEITRYLVPSKEEQGDSVDDDLGSDDDLDAGDEFDADDLGDEPGF